MTKITIEEIKKLREKTGAPVLECRQALEEAKGDLKKAESILKKKGIARAAKKAERLTACGLIETYVHQGRVGVMIELCSETDFVARNEGFRELAHELAMQVASMNPKDVKELLTQEYIRDPQKKIEDLVKETIAKFGENINIRRFERFQLGG